MDGSASFNYRLKLPFLHNEDYHQDPMKVGQLRLSCYDRDFIGSNDFIGQVDIDLSQAIQDSLLKKASTCLVKNYYQDYLLKEKI